MKNQENGLKRIINATYYSRDGLIAAWKHEAAFRQEVILLLILGIISFLLDVTALERLAMISSLILVIIVELLNSAIEATVDRVGAEHHELSGRAKDIASSAVFITLCLSVLTWLCILFS